MKLSELELLIHKYLSEQATDEEKAIVDNWLQHQPGDRITDPQKKQELIAAMWGNIFTAINKADHHAAVKYSRKGMIRSMASLQKKYMMRVAASLLLIAMAGMLVYFFTRQTTAKNTQYASITAGDSAAVQHLLPDGSKAWLFPGSTIHVPASYNEDDRQVQVTGRAFFEVKENRSKPFFVEAGALRTSVLGTSFEVNTLRPQFPAVVVRTGCVSVAWEGKELTQLSLNKRITIDLTGKPHAMIDSVNASALCTWWSGAFNFEQTPLPEVLQNLGQWYKYQIRMEGEKWKKEKLTIQVETHLNIQDALHLLCETLGAQYKMNGQWITIY